MSLDRTVPGFTDKGLSRHPRKLWRDRRFYYRFWS